MQDRARQVLDAVPEALGVTSNDQNSGWLMVQTTGQAGASVSEGPGINNRVLNALIEADISVLGFEAGAGHLQDAFLHLTGEAVGCPAE